MTEVRRRVLVVEDEMMIAMLVEEMVQDLGHTVVGVAMRLDTALALARDAEFDVALLDVNLGDAKSFPVAAVLRDRGIPFLFATGYGARGIDAEFAGITVLNKPFQADDLERALERTLSRDRLSGPFDPADGARNDRKPIFGR